MRLDSAIQVNHWIPRLKIHSIKNVLILGCIDDDNCAGSLECNGVHECIQADGVTVLKKIVLSTGSCKGCQGTAVENGPILEIIGGQIVTGVTECKTNALDHEDMIDFAPGNEAVFEGEADKDVLGSCYKVNKQKFIF